MKRFFTVLAIVVFCALPVFSQDNKSDRKQARQQRLDEWGVERGDNLSEHWHPFVVNYMQTGNVLIRSSFEYHGISLDQQVLSENQTKAGKLSEQQRMADIITPGLEIQYRPHLNILLSAKAAYLGTKNAGLDLMEYTDPLNAGPTHKSAHNAGLTGGTWNVSADLVSTMNDAEQMIGFSARLGYKGFYHDWTASGGEYEYPPTEGGSGSYSPETKINRYQISYHLPYIGWGIWYFKPKGTFLNVGMDLSYFPFVSETNTAYITDTADENRYRPGFTGNGFFQFVKPLSPFMALELRMDYFYQFPLDSASSAEQLQFEYWESVFRIGFIWSLK